MAAPMQFESRWVMVTGASSGLGREIATQLAREHRSNLVLVARRGDRLGTLAAELEQTYGVSVETVVADLSREDEVERAFSDATAKHTLYGVILNASVTHFGEHLDLPWPELKQLLHTNIDAIVQLVHLSVPYLLAQKQGGGVMLVASMAGVTPVPYQSAYSGTKAFLVGFGHGLWHELKHTDVSITTFVPGGIATEMLESSGLASYFGHGGLFIQSAEACACEAIAAFRMRKHTYVAGRVNQLGVLASKVLPRSFMVAQVAARYRAALALKKSSLKPKS